MREDMALRCPGKWWRACVRGAPTALLAAAALILAGAGTAEAGVTWQQGVVISLGAVCAVATVIVDRTRRR